MKKRRGGGNNRQVSLNNACVCVCVFHNHMHTMHEGVVNRDAAFCLIDVWLLLVVAERKE